MGVSRFGIAHVVVEKCLTLDMRNVITPATFGCSSSRDCHVIVYSLDFRLFASQPLALAAAANLGFGLGSSSRGCCSFGESLEIFSLPMIQALFVAAIALETLQTSWLSFLKPFQVSCVISFSLSHFTLFVMIVFIYSILARPPLHISQ